MRVRGYSALRLSCTGAHQPLADRDTPVSLSLVVKPAPSLVRDFCILTTKKPPTRGGFFIVGHTTPKSGKRYHFLRFKNDFELCFLFYKKRLPIDQDEKISFFTWLWLR